MKIGVFDSGLGGLMIARAITREMPDLDMVYCGDTLHLPYGSRSTEAIYEYTRRCTEFLFQQGCQIIIVACNTASAAALRQIQSEYLPQHYPDRRVLGVVVPTLETALDAGYERLGLIATNYITRTGIYKEELEKLNPQIQIFQQATPLLVPLIENDGMPWIDDVLRSYLEPLLAQNIDSLLLGCTHYVYLKNRVQRLIGDEISILSQDDVIPAKLKDYLVRHPEHDVLIGRHGAHEFYLTDMTDTYTRAGQELFGQQLEFKKAT